MKVINSTLTDHEFLMVEIHNPENGARLAIEASIGAGPQPFQIDRVRLIDTEADGMAIYQANTEEIDQVLQREISRFTDSAS